MWWLGGGWCKPRVPTKIAKIYVFVLYAYVVLITNYTVWDVSKVRMTHPW